MDLSNTSTDFNLTIKPEPITDKDNELEEDLLHTQIKDILYPDTEKQTYPYLMSDFDQFQKLKLEPLSIKSEGIEDETEILKKSFPYSENMCVRSYSNFEEFSKKKMVSLEIKSEHDPIQFDQLFCAEVLDSSTSDAEDTRNKNVQLSDVGESSELLVVQDEAMDLSYNGIDISYTDIKKECAGNIFLLLFLCIK